MPLKLLSTRPRGNIIFENFFANVGANTIIFNLPLFFQAVKLESASASGFRIGPAFIFSTTVSVSTGFIINATGHMKPLLVLGGLMSLIGVILLSLIQPSFNAWVATGFLVPMSMGMGFNFPTSSVAILAASTKEDQAVTTSTLSLFRTLGIGESFVNPEDKERLEKFPESRDPRITNALFPSSHADNSKIQQLRYTLLTNQ